MRCIASGGWGAIGLLLVAQGAASPAHAATVRATDPRIVEVTVYPDRAEVVREARIAVLAGATSVEFVELPFAVEPDSLRVSATGVPAVLGAVEIRDHAAAPRDPAETLALRGEVQRIEGELAKLASRERVATDLREFLKALRATTAQRESQQIGSGNADPTAVERVYGLLAARLEQLGDEELARRGAAQRLGEDLEVARAKLAAGPPAGALRSRVAAVEVETSQAGTLTLRLAYLVAGASWRPSYRAVLDPATGEVALVSEGVVRQETGEAWNGVGLRLSTASPARGVAPPEMAALFLRPMVGQLHGSRVRVFASEGDVEVLPAANRAYQNVTAYVSGVAGGEPAEAPAAMRDAEIAHSAYNVAFEVPGRSDVPADGAEHRVVLRQESLPGTLDYRAAPAIEPAAFLTSVVRAPAQYPLLEGPLRALVSGAYLGVYQLPETAPGAELTLPFGRDNRIRVERVREPQEHSAGGLGGKSREVAYEFRTRLENLRDKEVTLTLEDRLPVSEDERIVVELGRETTPGHQESEYRPGVLLWKLVLAAHEKRDVVLAYSVRFPKDVPVSGLD